MSVPSPAPGSAALVTGASAGIGEAFARELAVRGHGVILVARRRARLEALASELRERHGVRAEVAPADLADPGAREGLAATVDGLGLRVEILVNNAGLGVYAPFVTSDATRELEQVRVLVEAVVDLTHRYLPGMVDRGRGAVITVSSTSGFQAAPYNAGYGAAKAHVLFLSETLHAELQGTGVVVTAVCPGPVVTEFGKTNDVEFQDKLPQAAWVDAATVARDGLAAADRGKRVVVPGGFAVKAAFHPNRFAPTALTNPVVKRLMKRAG